MDEANGRPTKHVGHIALLATKLFVPRARQSLVSRPHLVDRLNEALNHKLTLVSAPAGFGKTTLLSTWLQRVKLPVAWLSLDEADNDPARFFSYLVAALQQIDPTVGRDVPGALEAGGAPRVDAVVGALVNDLVARPADFVLVLDDFHIIEEATIHEAIQSLVAHLPPGMHLVIATREDPPLPLARLRARDQLVELRAQDLRFTIDEAAIFLKDVMGLALDLPDVKELDARIEGWIAGLQLAALSMQNRQRPSELIAGLSGGHHFILSYLTEEVLRHLSPDAQSFLLETSVLTRLTGPLCDVVTGRGNCDALLRQLCASNAFLIPLDEGHDWYRYHHLFAELLRNQLNRAQPERVATLHTRASEWYERHGNDAAAAIEHAFAAGDHQRAARLLELHARPITLQGYAQTVENWLRRLPQEWRVAGPRASLAFGWSLLLRGRLDEIDAYLQNADVAIVDRTRSGAHIEAAAIMAEASALRACLCSALGNYERGCDFAREAVERAPKDDAYVRGMAHFSLAGCCHSAGKVDLAVEAYREALPLCQASGNTVACMLIFSGLVMVLLAQGRLRAAADLCRQAMDTTEQSAGASSPALVSVYSYYGAVLCEWGDWAAAQGMAERWLDLNRRGGHVMAAASGNAELCRLRRALGDSAGAQRALEEAIAALRRGAPAWMSPLVVSQQVALALAGGDVATAARALAQTGVGIDDPIDITREMQHIAYLHLLHYQGRQAPRSPYLDQALRLASGLLEAAESAGRFGRAIEILAMRALIYDAKGDARLALDDLSRALAIAEPEGYLRLFVDEGAPMARLLEAARAQGIRPAYVVRLLAAFPKKPAATPPSQPDLVEPLTGRELEVLRLIADGLSYEEVAQQLVVSLNTVRFHVKGIYGKLGADRRALAVDRARALKLL